MRITKNKYSMLNQLLVLLISAAAILAFYLSADKYVFTVANSAIIYYFCSINVVVLLGLCGQMSFASVTFMGLGAFFAGQLAKNYAVAPWLSIILAVILTTIVSAFFGVLLLRLKGAFFVFGTIALVNMFQVIFQNFKPLTGGPDGLYGIPKLNLFGIVFKSYQQWFWLLLICALLTALFVKRIRDTSLGRAMMAVRDNEIAAQGMGINIYRTKLTAFILSSSLAAFGGALLCFHNGVVSYSLFTFSVQMKFLSMAMLGGINSIVGTAFGTILVACLPELFRVLEQYMTLIYGIGVILMMIFMPTGLAGLWKKSISRLQQAIFKKEAEKHV